MHSCTHMYIHVSSQPGHIHWLRHISEDPHLQNLSTCFAVLRHIRSIRWSVSQQVLQLLVTSLVLTWLDYGNATMAVSDECGFYSQHRSPSTSHHCSVSFTGCGCLSRSSLNSLCLSTVACTVWLHHTLHVSCAMWQTSTHDDDCAPHRHCCVVRFPTLLVWCY